MKYLYSLLLGLMLFFSLFSFAQQMSKQVNGLNNFKTRNELDNLEVGKQMLNNAQNDFDKTVAYKKMGDASGKLGDYKDAINYLNTAIKYAEKINSVEEQILINNVFSQVYGRIGLFNKADERLEKSKQLALELQDPLYINNYYSFKMANNMEKGDYKNAIPYALNIISFIQEYLKKNPQKSREAYISFSEYYDGLALMYMKCDNWQNAKESIYKAEYYRSKIQKSDYNVGNYYYFSRAMLFAKQKNGEESKKYFDSAYSQSIKRNNFIISIKILEDRLSNQVDSKTSKYQDLTKKLLHLYQLKEKEQSKANILLDEYNEKEVLQSQEKTIYILTTSSISALILVSLILYLKRKQQKEKVQFLKIISDLEEKEGTTKILENTKTLSFRKVEKKTDLADYEQKKQFEQEQNIMKQLEKLEKKLFYTSNNISATQLAAMLQTTPKHLRYILKKYRNEDFYNYLNVLRINYCIKLLRENPKYRHYKLSAISNKCGYNSYSQFTINFKLKTGISPSKFINFLQDEQKNDTN